MKNWKEEYNDLKFFKEFDKATAEKIIGLGRIDEYGIKEYIIHENQELHEFMILLEGSVLVGINVPDKGKINLGTIYPGNMFSWSSLFPPHISTAYVKAEVPAKVMLVEVSKIHALIEKDPFFGYRLMRFISATLSQRLHDTRFQLINIVTI